MSKLKDFRNRQLVRLVGLLFLLTMPLAVMCCVVPDVRKFGFARFRNDVKEMTLYLCQRVRTGVV